jgi:hypothetical protein
MAAEDYRVEFDKTGVRVARPDGTQESVDWDKLRSVLIETNDQGPFADDFFWVLVTGGGKAAAGCVIPMGAQGLEPLLEHMQLTLPGFDNQAVIEASRSTENRTFLCWQRPANE